ncbi:helix-turn-helix domain-containing protein [Winogradskyella luteola]|uniref:Helix-turn-helix transcriptional regulator n=1 Tax=Winogradskyella luteola TaxID=2828330 RepID=A0A9X1F641_9FLAO|nr:helix-turn-helix transcriptional regulator [Winogradskyella luteola]MBV7268066.1 helix-turn-helix transcriptional regulator [Winogradskyella luteola]
MIVSLTAIRTFAKQIDVHAPVIGCYERDKVKPFIETAFKIAKAL